MAAASASQFDKLCLAAEARGLRVGLVADHGVVRAVQLRDRQRIVVAESVVSEMCDVQTAATEMLTLLVEVDRRRRA